MNLSKAAIRKLGYAVLVEGYFDFAQVFQTDAAPVVASCGTALTPQQAQLSRRFTSKVVLSYDPDAAGQGAAARSCELLVAEGFDVNVVVLDKGEDPDTFIRKKGRDRIVKDCAVRGRIWSTCWIRPSAGRRFRARRQPAAVSGQDADGRRPIPDAAARDQFADRIAHKARITEEVVRAEIRKAAVQKQTTLTARELPSFGQLKNAEKALIWGLIHNTGEALEALGRAGRGGFGAWPAGRFSKWPGACTVSPGTLTVGVDCSV